MGTISTFIFKIINDENIGSFNSPGMVPASQGDDKDEGTDT